MVDQSPLELQVEVRGLVVPDLFRKTNVALFHRGVPFPKPIQLKTLLPPSLKFSKKRKERTMETITYCCEKQCCIVFCPQYFCSRKLANRRWIFQSGSQKCCIQNLTEYCGRWAGTVNILASQLHKKFKFRVWMFSISNYNLNFLLPCKIVYHGNKGGFWYLSFNKHGT